MNLIETNMWAINPADAPNPAGQMIIFDGTNGSFRKFNQPDRAWLIDSLGVTANAKKGFVDIQIQSVIFGTPDGIHIAARNFSDDYAFLAYDNYLVGQNTGIFLASAGNNVGIYSLAIFRTSMYIRIKQKNKSEDSFNVNAIMEL